MSDGHPHTGKVAIVESSLQEVKELVQEHLQSLSCPLDSWLEDQLVKSTIFRLIYDGHGVGYAGQIKKTLQFFYVRRAYFRHAPAILEQLVHDKAIERIFVMIQDSLLSALVAEWDYDKEKEACWFTDCGGVDTVQNHSSGFRTAVPTDIPKIREVAGDFFEDAAGASTTLRSG